MDGDEDKDGIIGRDGDGIAFVFHVLSSLCTLRLLATLAGLHRLATRTALLLQ